MSPSSGPASLGLALCLGLTELFARSNPEQVHLDANADRSQGTVLGLLGSCSYRCVRSILLATFGAQNKDEGGCDTARLKCQSASLLTGLTCKVAQAPVR